MDSERTALLAGDVDGDDFAGALLAGYDEGSLGAQACERGVHRSGPVGEEAHYAIFVLQQHGVERLDGARGLNSPAALKDRQVAGTPLVQNRGFELGDEVVCWPADARRDGEDLAEALKELPPFVTPHEFISCIELRAISS